MTARLLLVGDVHLGRRPTRLPEVLAESGLHASQLTPATAWKTVVETALERAVTAVVFAGDVVEDEDDFYEVYEPLRSGITRLLDAGIRVLAVAGNHDVKVLPRLADAIPGFRLLGRDGVWEREVLEVDGAPALALMGWSFPDRHVPWSPLDAPLPIAGDGLVTLGVLHCDMGASGSHHAPVTRTALVDAYPEAWFLGHIHAPGDLSGPRPIGYLGSLVGLDPTETGRRGPWLVELDSGGRVSAEQLPLAPLRWESIDVDVSELSDPRELEVALALAVTELHTSLGEELTETRAVGVRARIIGATPLSHEFGQEVQRDELHAFSALHDEVRYFIDKVYDRTTTAQDLESLAAGTTPPALVARRLLVLERGPDDAQCARLVADARGALERVAHAQNWSSLGSSELDDARIAGLLADAARAALDELLVQEDVR